MIFRAGFQSFELQRAFELPKPLFFASHDEALKWLKQLGSQYPESVLRFREFLARLSGDLETSRLTDHGALERMAELLYSRKVVIVAREERSSSGTASSKTAPPAVAFPLSERTTRRPSTSSQPPPPPDDPPTFDPRIDPVAQAAALVAAAREEWALCPE